jgi:hypothetical protein
LRDVVAAAQPGVAITINVYTGTSPRKQKPGLGEPTENIEDEEENYPQLVTVNLENRLQLIDSITNKPVGPARVERVQHRPRTWTQFLYEESSA